MAVSRVTTQMMSDRIMRDLRFQTRRLLSLERQLATGYRVNTPSDDPLAARRAIASGAEIKNNEQYLSNITNVGPFLTESETALSSVTDILQRTNELTLQGINGTNEQAQRDEIAREVDQLLESTLSQTNSETAGRYVFAGSRTRQEPFEATRNAAREITAVNYVGNDEAIDIEISGDVTLPINITGDEAFVAGVDIHQTLINIRDNLRTGNMSAVENELQNVQDGIEQTNIVRSGIGAIQNRLDRVVNDLEIVNLQLEGVISENIDADFAEVIVELNAQTNAFQAALNASGRIIQPSLLNFLA